MRARELSLKSIDTFIEELSQAFRGTKVILELPHWDFVRHIQQGRRRMLPLAMRAVKANTEKPKEIGCWHCAFRVDLAKGAAINEREATRPPREFAMAHWTLAWLGSQTHRGLAPLDWKFHRSERGNVASAPAGVNYLTRARYSSVRVSISILSPISTKAGTWMTWSVARRAGFMTLPEVSPLTAGSV